MSSFSDLVAALARRMLAAMQATRPPPQAPAPQPASRRSTGITATVFGGASDRNKSAYDGHLIGDTELCVALPARFTGARPKVRVINAATGKSALASIEDIGPWNDVPGDPYWRTGSRPQAETGHDQRGRKTNLAGIDLSLALARAIGIDGKGKVDWEFVAAAGAPSRAPKAQPAVDGVTPWLAFSAKELGVRETPGPKSTARVVAYRAIAGCDLKGDDGDVPWCRIYICAMLSLSGLPYRKDWMARAVERDPNFVKLDGPALGAICSFWRGSRTGGLGHTGFYRGECKGRVLVEGGNEQDAVRRAFFPKDGAMMGLAGCYWPKTLPLPKIAAVRVHDDGRPVGSVT